jgi:hypothetical protein
MPLLCELGLLRLQPGLERSATRIALLLEFFQLPARRFRIRPRCGEPGSDCVTLTGQRAGPLAEFVIVVTHRQQVARQFLDLMGAGLPQHYHLVVSVRVFG